MTTEEKARAYDKTIKKAESLYKVSEPMSGCNVIIETLFPELKESEDERIRKSLVILLQHFCKGYRVSGLEFSVSFQDMLAWLKKQGETFTKKDIDNAYIEGMVCAKNELEKQSDTSVFDVPKISIKDAVEVASRMQYIEDDMKPIADFIIDYANWDLHKDEWNQPTLTVPLFRVLDALIQRGKPYCECSQNSEKQGEQKASYTTIAETGDGGLNALVTRELPTEMKSAEESLGIDSATYNKIIDECIFGEQKPTDEEMKTLLRTEYEKGRADAIAEMQKEWNEENEVKINRIVACLENLNVADNDILLKDVEWIKSLKGRVQPKQEWSEEDEPQKELAETYLAVFDKKFPILPTLKGKQLADYKNFLNKCQQILGLKYWGIHPTQAKLFEKLSLLWAAWGAEHLQGLGQTDGDLDDEILWSKEDEIYYKRVQLSIEWARAHNRISEGSCDEQLNWLKSLRPQNKWKPSDEQIRFLQAVVNDPNNASSESCHIVLKDILEKLKKLKEG